VERLIVDLKRDKPHWGARKIRTPLSAGANPNDLWCADFKGEFKLGNGRYCYPLTVSDHAARYLLLCEAFESTREAPVIAAFQRLFRDRGLPVAIRSDNGLPFASPNGLYNLSRLSVWRLRLGIASFHRLDLLEQQFQPIEFTANLRLQVNRQ
jgi:transposase InsO family protein